MDGLWTARKEKVAAKIWSEIRRLQRGKIMEEIIVIMITVGTEAEAVLIANSLLEQRLIACASLLHPIRSLYRWKGQFCDEPEVLLLCKTKRRLFNDVSDLVTSLHSYEVPEVVAIPFVEGFHKYLKWVAEVTRDS